MDILENILKLLELLVHAFTVATDIAASHRKKLTALFGFIMSGCIIYFLSIDSLGESSAYPLALFIVSGVYLTYALITWLKGAVNQNNQLTCPCCGEPFTFWDYLNQKRDINEEINHTVCKQCNRVVLLSYRKQPIRDIGVTVIFLMFIFVALNNAMTWMIALGHFFAIIAVGYLQFRFERLECYTDDEIRQSYLYHDRMSGIVALAMVATALFFVFYLFLY